MWLTICSRLKRVRLPFGDDRPAIERHAFGQHAGLLDALAVERHAFIETAELHRMTKAEAPRSVRVGDLLDQQHNVAEALRKGRGQALERAPRDRLYVGGARAYGRQGALRGSSRWN